MNLRALVSGYTDIFEFPSTECNAEPSQPRAPLRAAFSALTAYMSVNVRTFKTRPISVTQESPIIAWASRWNQEGVDFDSHQTLRLVRPSTSMPTPLPGSSPLHHPSNTCCLPFDGLSLRKATVALSFQVSSALHFLGPRGAMVFSRMFSSFTYSSKAALHITTGSARGAIYSIDLAVKKKKWSVWSLAHNRRHSLWRLARHAS